MSLVHQVTNPILEAVAGNPTGEPSVPFVLALTVPDDVTADLDWTLPNYAIRVIDVKAVKTANAGGAANTVQLQTSAAVAVSSVLSTNIADTTIARTTTLDDASHEFAAGGTMRVRRVKAGGNAACLVYALCVRT